MKSRRDARACTALSYSPFARLTGKRFFIKIMQSEISINMLMGSLGASKVSSKIYRGRVPLSHIIKKYLSAVCLFMKVSDKVILCSLIEPRFS